MRTPQDDSDVSWILNSSPPEKRRGWESEIKYLRRFSCCCVLFSPRCTFERFLSRQFHFAAQIHSVHSFIRSLLLDVIYSASRQRSFTVLTSVRMGRPPLSLILTVEKWRKSSGSEERDKNEIKRQPTTPVMSLFNSKICRKQQKN